jgi:hypothetical protein
MRRTPGKMDGHRDSLVAGGAHFVWGSDSRYVGKADDAVLVPVALIGEHLENENRLLQSLSPEERDAVAATLRSLLLALDDAAD